MDHVGCDRPEGGVEVVRRLHDQQRPGGVDAERGEDLEAENLLAQAADDTSTPSQVRQAPPRTGLCDAAVCGQRWTSPGRVPARAP